jgi:D-glycero-alpha-D-manno-heptose-7-phosphate kinase
LIISRTPYRVSFFGGGTDYPDYYLENGGKVMGVTIDKYSYITVRKLPPYFDHKHRVAYSRTENVDNYDEIQHPSVRETLKYMKVDYGVSIHHDGDIPALSGMGSSSAFTVGLLNTMYALEGKMISKEELVKESIIIEQERIGESVGSQDQTFAAYGGLNVIEFSKNGRITVKAIILKQERLQYFESCLMLFYTGMSRIASKIASDKIKNIPNNKDNLSKIKDLVDDAFSIITSPDKDMNVFGELLNETWYLKKGLSNMVANQEIDHIYEVAINNGAAGGKLCGAGGGGFMLFFVEPKNQLRVRDALKNYLYVPFKFDFEGTKIIVYKPDHEL